MGNIVKKKSKNKFKNTEKINYKNKKFNLFKSIFLINVKNIVFYSFRSNIFGACDYKLNVLFFFSNCYKHVYLSDIIEFNLFGIKFSLSSLCLCLNRELYKKNLLIKRNFLKK